VANIFSSLSFQREENKKHDNHPENTAKSDIVDDLVCVKWIQFFKANLESSSVSSSFNLQTNFIQYGDIMD